MSGGGGSGSGGGGVNKVALTIFGAGVAGMIIVMGGKVIADDDEPDPAPTAVASAAGGGTAPTSVPSQPTRQAQPVATKPADDDLRGGPDNVILTIVANGMPARISAAPLDPGIELRQRVRSICSPDEQYPAPCITDYVAKRGTVLVVTAGDSRAGFWPVLDYVKGPGCDLTGKGDTDVKCTITLASDTEITAMYYGGENPGLQHYQFPTCPTHRGDGTAAWVARCK